MPDWNPEHPSLKNEAPHEPAASLRMYKAGAPSKKIMKLLHLKATQLIKQIESGKQAEEKAKHFGHPIHDGLIDEEEPS